MLPKLFVEKKLWKSPDPKRKKHPVLNLYNPRKVFRDIGYGGVCIKRYEFNIVPGLSVWQKETSQESLVSNNPDDDRDYEKREAFLDALDSVTTLEQYIDLCAADVWSQQKQTEEKYESNNTQRTTQGAGNIVGLEYIQRPKTEYITPEQYTQMMLLTAEEIPISECTVPSKSSIKFKTAKKTLSCRFIQADGAEELQKSELKLAITDSFDKKMTTVAQLSSSLSGSNNCICKESRSTTLNFEDSVSAINVNINCYNCVIPDTEKEKNIVSRQAEDLFYCNAGALATADSYSCVLQDGQITANDEQNNEDTTYQEASCDCIKPANDVEGLIEPNWQVSNTGILSSNSRCHYVMPPKEELDLNFDQNGFDRKFINIKDILSNPEDLIYKFSDNPVTAVLSRNHKVVIDEVENIRNKVNNMMYIISNVERLISNLEHKVENPTLSITKQHDGFLIGLQERIFDDFHREVQCNRRATDSALKAIDQFKKLFGEVNTKECLETETTVGKTGCNQLKYVEKLEKEIQKKKQIFINECKQGIIFKEIKQLEEIQNQLSEVQDYIEQIVFN